MFCDCILLDLGLPDKPGEELLPLIRANPLHKDTAVVWLWERIMFMRKPGLPMMLRRMVERVLIHSCWEYF